jgi:hypothetical protein
MRLYKKRRSEKKHIVSKNKNKKEKKSCIKKRDTK